MHAIYDTIHRPQGGIASGERSSMAVISCDEGVLQVFVQYFHLWKCMEEATVAGCCLLFRTCLESYNSAPVHTWDRAPGLLWQRLPCGLLLFSIATVSFQRSLPPQIFLRLSSHHPSSRNIRISHHGTSYTRHPSWSYHSSF